MKKNKSPFEELEANIAQYEVTCQTLAEIFAEKNELGDDWFWVSNNIGGVAIFRDYIIVSMDDIITDLTIKEVDDSRSFINWYHEREANHTNMNLQSWKKGCPLL